MKKDHPKFGWSLHYKGIGTNNPYKIIKKLEPSTHKPVLLLYI